MIWGSLLGSIIIVGMLLWAGPEAFFDQIKNVSLPHVLIYIFSSMVVYVFRALRFRLLVGNRGSLAELYSVVSIHTFLLNILPFSSGDLSLPLLLQKFKISDSYLEGIPSLVVARLQDLIITLLFLGVSLLWVGKIGDLYRATDLMLGITIGFISLGVLFFFGRKKMRSLDLSKLQARCESIPILNKVMAIAKPAIISAKEISRIIIVQTIVLALVIRLIGVFGAYYLINGIGLSMELPVAFLFCSVYVFLPYLPINTVAGLGVTEAFIGGFFLLIGVQKEVIIPASIQIHFLQLSVAILLGGLGFAQMYFLRKQIPKPAMSKDAFLH